MLRKIIKKISKVTVAAGVAMAILTSMASATSIKDYPRVAVMNFGNKAITSKGFRDQDFNLCTEYAIYQLQASGWFDLIDYEELNTIAQMHNINNSGLVDPSTIVAMGQFAGAEYMIVGNVTGLTLKENIAGLQVKNAKAGVGEHVVNASVAVRIVDIKTGRIMGAGIGKGSSTSTLTEIGFIKDKWVERMTGRSTTRDVANILIDEYNRNKTNRNENENNRNSDSSHMDYNNGSSASGNSNSSYGANQNYNDQYGNQANSNGSANFNASSNRNLNDSTHANSNYGNSARQDYDGDTHSNRTLSDNVTDTGSTHSDEHADYKYDEGDTQHIWGPGQVASGSGFTGRDQNTNWDIERTSGDMTSVYNTAGGKRELNDSKNSNYKNDHNQTLTDNTTTSNHQTNTQNDSGYSNSSSDRILTDNSNANAHSNYNDNASNSGYANGNANQSENYNSSYNDNSRNYENMNTNNNSSNSSNYNRNTSDTNINKANNTETNTSDNRYYTMVKEQEVYGITIGTKQVSEIQVINAISKAIRDAFYGKMGLLTTLNDGKPLNIKTGF